MCKKIINRAIELTLKRIKTLWRHKNAKTTAIKEKCVLSRKQQISPNRPNYHVRQNQKIPIGVNPRSSEEIQNEN